MIPLPEQEIFLRSPYWLTISETNLDYVLCELRIWTGNLQNEPVEADAKLRSTGLNDKTSIDIAEFARDFVEVTYDGSAESNAVFISYQLTIYQNGDFDNPTVQDKVYLTGLDGYGVFQEGVNFQWYNEVMITDSDVTAYPDTSIAIPVKQFDLEGYTLQKRTSFANPPYTDFHSVTGITTSEDTSDVIRYVDSAYQGQYADRIVFHFYNKPDEIVNITYGNCTKYGLTKCYFVNRLGCIQEVHYFGRFDVSMKTKSESYKRNIIENGNYSKTRHQKYTLNKNGSVLMSINSGWKNESENDTMMEMMLSEQVWLTIATSKLGLGWLPKLSNSWVVPVNIKTEQTEIKNKLNDKLINYKFKFEAAHDWINTVR